MSTAPRQRGYIGPMPADVFCTKCGEPLRAEFCGACGTKAGTTGSPDGEAASTPTPAP